MTVTRKSPFSGKVHTMEIPLTPEQVKELESPNRRKVQEICPNLTADQREFIMTGITREEWAKTFA